jgi:hypothetical protein
VRAVTFPGVQPGLVEDGMHDAVGLLAREPSAQPAA